MYLGYDLGTWAIWAILFVIAAVVFVRELKRQGQRRYAPANARQRVESGVLLAAMLLAWTIYFAGWDLFGGYERQVAVVVQIIGVLYVFRLLAKLERP